LGAFNLKEKSGYILLQVQGHGEAWYVYPKSNNRYFLNRPSDAYLIMKKLALGVKHDYLINTEIFPDNLSGLILLDAEKNGEAYYIYPKDNKKYYLGRPADAFRIMSKLGLGISDTDLKNIPVANMNDANMTNSKKVLQDVPFTSQAPYGGWKDIRQEDGCEEASSLMAVRWALNQTLTREEALKEILGSSDYTLKKYGEYRDVSAIDTVDWIIKDYFNYQNAAVKNNISLEDIIAELKKGNLVLVPANGQLLHNPNYTGAGPLTHMLLIRGYDPLKNTFITNDSGTRRGELYEYDSKVLFEAISAYPTGNHEVVKEIKKDMIVVWK
jgi:hypothetical protein